jgi:NhaA family Na+:H+ antiporter
LAIVDDLGAIVVIAIFYTEKLETTYLLLSGLVILVLIILNFLKLKNIFFI